MTTVNIEVSFFASVREALVGGIPSTSIKLEEECEDGGDAAVNTATLRAKLATLYPKLASLVVGS